jgi:uncharacterized phage-associated protein
MVNVFDVAAYILKKRGRMTALKLQKLVYYSQAWSLVWDERAVKRGDPTKLSDVQRETIDAVLNFYGDKTSAWLSQLTHREAPWRKAREGLAPTERGENVITLASMHDYYDSLGHSPGDDE